ncbi:MAG: NUDIX domain-containing protein [Saprospiraceae bacterium]|nr:NUDIX domain-containing protein [Saprospiraceae bacterium]
MDFYKKDANALIFKYNEKSKYLLNFIDKAEKTKKSLNIYIHHKNLNLLREDFFSLFKVIKAGGGLVLNTKGEVLLIFRRGSWDLPKGKKEKGEKRKETAIREVQEETGLNQLTILNSLPDTYHTYRTSKERVIKLSYWYLMETLDMGLTPQTEEDIEIAKWVNISELESNSLSPMYGNIQSLIDHFLSSIR